MKRYAAFFLLALSLAFPAHATPQEDNMLAVIQKENLGRNLLDVAWKELQHTETYRMMVFKLGEDKAMENMKKEIAAATPPYQDEWNRKLAATYLEFYTPEEIESVTTKKEKSPYAGKYLMHRAAVGLSMKNKSADIISRLNDQVLTACAPYVEPIKDN